MKKFLYLCLYVSLSKLSLASSINASTPKTGGGSNLTTVNIAVAECGTATPCYVIKNSVTQLSQAVNQNMSEQQSLNMIVNSILPQIDFNLMTKYVMGASWKKASSDQQLQITNLFKQLLVYQYSNALGKLKGAHVSVDSSVLAGEKQNKAAVKGTFKVVNNGNSNIQPINIEYDLARIGANWKIYDVKIENVSIVTTYRSQFNETVNSSGVDDLIKQLQTKVQGLKSK